MTHIQTSREAGWRVVGTALIMDTLENSQPFRNLFLAESLWHTGEYVWAGTMSIDHFQIDTHYHSFAEKFFGDRAYLNQIEKGYVWNDTGSFIPYEHFVKLCWLSEEFLDNGGFRNPMGAHYNPRIGANQIHPGGMRQQVAKLFLSPGDPLDILYFNTGGFYDNDTMLGLQVVPMVELVRQGFDGNIVAEHGSLIPHLMRDVGEIADRKAEYFQRIKQNLSNGFKVYTNLHQIVECLDPQLVTKHQDEATVVIEASVDSLYECYDRYNYDALSAVKAKGLIFSALCRNYQDHQLTVTIKEKS